MGISTDARATQTAFAASLGNIPYPVLSDFHPKGHVSTAFGVYNQDRGTSDRAIVIIDKEGYIQYTSSLSLSLGQLERDLYLYTGLYETEDSDISPSPMISNLAIVVSIVVLVIVVSIRHKKTIRL